MCISFRTRGSAAVQCPLCLSERCVSVGTRSERVVLQNIYPDVCALDFGLWPEGRTKRTEKAASLTKRVDHREPGDNLFPGLRHRLRAAGLTKRSRRSALSGLGGKCDSTAKKDGFKYAQER